MLVVLLVSASAGAEEAPDQSPSLPGLLQAAGLGASLRSGYWSSSRTLDDREHLGTAALWLRAAPRLTSDVSLFAEGWVRNQDLPDGGATDGLLREAYLDLRLGPVDLRAGKQIIVWGRADRINPTDNLTPRDFTLLVPDDEDQRFGTPAIRATYYLGGLALSGIWLPGFESDTVPLRRPPPPIVIRERDPGGTLAQGAVRLEHTGGLIDWSLSYFDGLDRIPDLAVGSVGPAGVELVLRPHRIRAVGADAATTVGRYGLRGEAAYTFTEDGSGGDPAVRNPFFFMVVGGDRTFREHLNVNVQYLLRVVTAYHNPSRIRDPLTRDVAVQADLITNELDPVQHSFSLRVSNRWLNETLEAEVVGLVSVQRFGWALRPRVTYALSDHWRAAVGADVFGGNPRSFLGNLRDNTTAFLELRWSY